MTKLKINIIVVKTSGIRSHGRRRSTWEDNINMHEKYGEFKNLGSI
jgi:hypothetical protein